MKVVFITSFLCLISSISTNLFSQKAYPKFSDILISGNRDSIYQKGDYFAKGKLPDSYKSTYTLGFRFATLAIPFKFRPTIGEKGNANYRYQNITTEVSLGECLAYRIPLAPKSNNDFYLNPFVFGGLSTIDYNSAVNAKNDKGEADMGTAYTWCIGLNLEVKKTQIAFVAGKDNALGDKGDEWIYNKQWWFSFGLGYRFFQAIK